MKMCQRAYSLKRTSAEKTWLSTELIDIGLFHIIENLSRVYPSVSKEVCYVTDLCGNPAKNWPKKDKVSTSMKSAVLATKIDCLGFYNELNEWKELYKPLLDLVIDNINRMIAPLQRASRKKCIILPFCRRNHWTTVCAIVLYSTIEEI